MRILQVITLCELGGAQSVVANLSNKLCKEHQVIVVAGEGDGKMFSLLNPSIQTERCRFLKRSLSPITDLKAIFELKRIYKKYRPDIIHLHSSKAGMLGRIAFPRKKIVYTVHGFDSIRVAYRKFLPLEKAMQNRCKAIVAVSNYDYKNLLTENISNNIHSIYNGIEKPKVLQSDSVYANAFGRYKKTILSIARMSPPKRFDIFIETSKLLPEYGFIWIGNQQPVTNAPDNCLFMGNIPNAGALCRYADLFMLCSDYEGLPMVVLEAQSFGRPVVASNVGGISEIVHNGENGYTVENNPCIFAKHIKEILEDKQKYQKFSLASKQLFETKLTADIMVNEYIKIYTK